MALSHEATITNFLGTYADCLPHLDGCADSSKIIDHLLGRRTKRYGFESPYTEPMLRANTITYPFDFTSDNRKKPTAYTNLALFQYALWWDAVFPDFTTRYRIESTTDGTSSPEPDGLSFCTHERYTEDHPIAIITPPSGNEVPCDALLYPELNAHARYKGITPLTLSVSDGDSLIVRCHKPMHMSVSTVPEGTLKLMGRNAYGDIIRNAAVLGNFRTINTEDSFPLHISIPENEACALTIYPDPDNPMGLPLASFYWGKVLRGVYTHPQHVLIIRMEQHFLSSLHPVPS